MSAVWGVMSSLYLSGYRSGYRPLYCRVGAKKVSELCVPTGDGTWHGSVSIGLSARAVDMADYEALIKCADLGVYEARRAGKNCVRTTGS